MKPDDMKIFFTVLAFYILLAACNSSKKLVHKTQVQQGIKGIVFEKTGNRMPSPDVPESEGKPLKTTVFVFENTHISQVQRTGSSPLYDSIMTQLVKSVESDEEGRFAVELEPGHYSIFTHVKGKFYANHFDEKNNIAPVVVEKNKVSEVNITVSASASF